MDEFNNHNLEKAGNKNTLDSSSKQSKYISTRKRKELINTESDNEDNSENRNTPKPKIENDESKKEEETNNNQKYEYNNKYKTIDNSQNKQDDSMKVKTNTELQEKLKKIFMNRDKVKFQYAKQDIPDNLKYHSDESELSENDELRKSKSSKKKTTIISSSKKDNEIIYPYQRESIKSSNKRKNIDLKFSNNRNEKKNSDLNDNPPLDFNNDEKIVSLTKEEVIKNNNSNQRKKSMKSDNTEDEHTISSKKNSMNKNERVRGKFKYSNIHNNEKNQNEIEKQKENKIENEENPKNEKIKKNILLKVFQKIEKKEENSEKENDEQGMNKNNYNNEEKDEKIDKKQKLLKLLIQKKNSSEYEEDLNNENNNRQEIEDENTKEKENRRRKIIEEIQNGSDQKNKENENKKEESFKEEKEDKDDNEENDNDKGTYISNAHKNKLTISIKPKSKLIKQISSSSLIDNKEEEQNKEKEKENIEENPKKKKTNALINILKKLNKKKTEEQLMENNNKEQENNNQNNDIDINESEIEKEAEKIRKKERKIQERKMAKENMKNKNRNEIDQEEDSNTFNSISYNKQNQEEYNITKEKDKEIKKEEFLKRNQLKEDLRSEIEMNKEEESTGNNSSKTNLLNSQNTQLTNLENEDSRQKDINTNLKKAHKKKVSTRNNFIVDQGAAPNEIVVNGMPKSKLERSYDNSNNAYVKRRIPTGKSSMNVYKPRRADIRGRSQEKVINDYYDNASGNYGFGKNNNVNSNNYSKYQNSGKSIGNKLAYMRKKAPTQECNNFVMNNHSFCEYQVDNNNDNMDMDVDIGGGLNSSFDAYMQMQMDVNNNFGNNYNNRNQNRNIFYITAAKNFNNNRKMNKIANASSKNINYMNGYSNKIPHKKNFNNDENIRNYRYGNNNYNGNNNYFNNEPNYNNNNSNFNQNTNYINNNINSLYRQRQGQFTTYNEYNQNSSSYNNNQFKQYITPSSPAINNSIYNNNNNYYANSPSNLQRFTPNKNNDIYSNETPRGPRAERNISINIEDLMVLEEKLNEIIIALNKNHCMHNECFEFWNYHYNCSLYGRLETLFKSEEDQSNVQLSINHLLISVMICYDFSFEIEILNNEFSILIDILTLNHRNLIIIYEHILSKISSESMYNPWVFKLKKLVNNFNQTDVSNYISNDGRIFNSIEKIMYNLSVIVQNIRVLLKNYKTRRIEYLTSIFKKIGEKTYEEINSFFRDNILRVDNVKGSVLASVFLKENQYFKTEPAPYIKTKNRKPYSLILDLDETLVHFKVNSEDDSEGVLQIRPGVIPFLELVSKFYELIIFTAATQDYGDLLIDAIEENNVYFEHRFYRQHTVIMGNDFIKDLTRVGRPLDKIIIVDNMPQNFRLQKENGINIKAFWGEDVNDNALEELGKILVNIARDGGDVRIGLEKYRDEIVKNVTSNISRNNY